MALQKTISLPNNLGGTTEIQNAYIRVDRSEVTKNTMSIEVGIYESAEGQKRKLSFYGAEYDLSGNNPIQQAYEHLKTLPEFAGAADV